MNAAEWHPVANSIVADTLAVVGEFLMDPALESFRAALHHRYRAAGQARTPRPCNRSVLRCGLRRTHGC
jgi:hypothetical protein